MIVHKYVRTGPSLRESSVGVYLRLLSSRSLALIFYNEISFKTTTY